MKATANEILKVLAGRIDKALAAEADGGLDATSVVESMTVCMIEVMRHQAEERRRRLDKDAHDLEYRKYLLELKKFEFDKARYEEEARERRNPPVSYKY